MTEDALLAADEWVDHVPLLACEFCGSTRGVYGGTGDGMGEFRRCASCGRDSAGRALVAQRATSLLGHEVVVTLARDSDDPATVARGTLLAWADSGEIVVRDEIGFVHYCWPMLDVAAKEATP